MSIHESALKIIECSWGIIIEIKGTIEPITENETKGKVKINDFLFLDLSKYENMNIENKNKISNGLVWVSDLIPKNERTVIRIVELGINPSNFQIEGLFFGMALWLSTYYGFSLPKFYHSYSKEQNKYLFWFENNNERNLELLY